MKRRKIMLIIIFIFLVSTFILLGFKQIYKNHEINNYGYDIKNLSISVDNKESAEIPERGLYSANVICTNGTGKWDYNSWSLDLNGVGTEESCEVQFLANLTQVKYDELIKDGVEHRRNTYRGKDITEYHEDGSLYTMISSGTFDDIYVGDYIIANDIKWLVADIDNYLYTGDTSLTKHHLTVIPAKPLINTSINESGSSAGGYYNSEMVKTTLPNILSTYIKPAFNNHILSYRNLLVYSVRNDVVSSTFPELAGASYGWGWYDRQIDLMSEANVYGTNVFSSSGFDTGIDIMQYALFKLKPELVGSDGNERFNYWLKNVASSTYFTDVAFGVSNLDNVSFSSMGVRPRFLIG